MPAIRYAVQMAVLMVISVIIIAVAEVAPTLILVLKPVAKHIILVTLALEEFANLQHYPPVLQLVQLPVMVMVYVLGALQLAAPRVILILQAVIVFTIVLQKPEPIVLAPVYVLILILQNPLHTTLREAPAIIIAR